MIVQVCIGSSCHLKGSHEIVEMMRKAIENNHLEFEITLAGSFCAGKCAGEGVTIKVDDEIISGVTKENFDNFFKENILGRLA